MQLTLSHITYSYDDAPGQALVPLTATFTEGWTGIVGANGSGKTTLLKLACGELAPTGGHISPQVSGLYCSQETERHPEALEDFALSYTAEAIRIRRILEIEDDWAFHYDTLSQGERKRLHVATALWLDPPVLALDEPTNHIDAECRSRLIKALAGYRGVGLLVSHDRELLDELVSQCLFLSESSATMRPQNYSEGRKQAELERTTAQRERRQAKAELSRLQQTKISREQEASRADGKRSKRTIAKGDRDAKSRIDLAIFSGQDGKAGGRSVQMDARLAAARQRVKDVHIDKIYNAEIWLDAEPSRRKLVAELAEGCLAFGTGKRLSCFEEEQACLEKTCFEQACLEKTCFEQVRSKQACSNQEPCLQIPHLTVGPFDHIALVGPNGAGKSTLITALMSEIAPDLRVLSIPQELSTQERCEQLVALKALPQQQRGRVLSIVAQLNSNPERLLSGNLTSPGETRKLMLALGILARPQIIILDEPTNHLDLISIEALERLLAACPCALVLASHDKMFLEATTSVRWEITPSLGGSLLETHI